MMQIRIACLSTLLGLAVVAAAVGAEPLVRDGRGGREIRELLAREWWRVTDSPLPGGRRVADDGPATRAPQSPQPTEPTDAPPGAAAPVCPAVASPIPVLTDPLPSAEPLGSIETTTADRFTDDYLYSPDGQLKIGTRREWGSTVVFFGLADGNPGINDSNTIDANDTGRELQVALYDYPRLRQSCAWNASCLKDLEEGCGKEITFLGWNPVQGGNECEHGSGTESVIIEPGRLEAAVVPLFWNPDWRRQDCNNMGCSTLSEAEFRSDVRYRQRLRFVDSNVVEILMEYTNLSPIDHAPAFQEFPTLYSSFGKVGQDLRVVLDSQGNAVSVDEPANDGFFTREFTSPGGFAALQNVARDYGVGLYYESRQRDFQAWQLVGQFNNFRALFEFGLPALSTVRARAYLILGGFDSIAEAAAAIDGRLSPFGELEAPAPDATVGDSLWLSGWALDNGEVVKLEVLIDGEPVATRAPNRRRPEVCTLWPGYDMCAGKVGYAARVDLSGVSRCAHLLEIRATDDDGNRRTIARRRIFVADPVCTDPGCEAGRPATHPVFRFFWAGNDDADHQFSRSDEVPPDHEAEGIGFELFTEPAAGRRPLWQKWCNSCTDHLQTTIGAEAEPDYSGSRLLGYCSAVRTRDAPRRLLRLWSERLSDHFVSADPPEWEAAEAQGYVFEGSCWVP
jgi:hypothetical protein